MKKILRHRLTWPIAALLALIVVNTIARPTFLRITVQDGELYGAIVDILRNSAPLMLVALGMTIVIATRGIDLSVGAIMAVSGAVALTIIEGSSSPGDLGTVGVAILVGVLVALLLGVWNGFLVAALGIQPIIATLVLMLAGRGIALLITGGFITTINSEPYQFMAQGYVLGLPFAFYVSVAAIVVIALLERRTALGMLTEAVGINPEASRLAGVRSRGIVWGAYIVSGILAGLAGILCTARTSWRPTPTPPGSTSSWMPSSRWCSAAPRSPAASSASPAPSSASSRSRPSSRPSPSSASRPR
jgi:galactofuranose transport system permease protein